MTTAPEVEASGIKHSDASLSYLSVVWNSAVSSPRGDFPLWQLVSAILCYLPHTLIFQYSSHRLFRFQSLFFQPTLYFSKLIFLKPSISCRIIWSCGVTSSPSHPIVPPGLLSRSPLISVPFCHINTSPYALTEQARSDHGQHHKSVPLSSFVLFPLQRGALLPRCPPPKFCWGNRYKLGQAGVCRNSTTNPHWELFRFKTFISFMVLLHVFL